MPLGAGRAVGHNALAGALPGGRIATTKLLAMESLFTAALDCLRATDPEEKLERTAVVLAAWRGGRLAIATGAECASILPTSVAGRPDKPRLVAPRDLPRRGLGSTDGRAALLHAIAHIEFNAINLAWDAVYRFRGMPRDYYDDFVGIAADEARHFRLLSERLAAHGTMYGDLPAHDGLWTMAEQTADSCLNRMALVPRVLEARGLDVTPAMISKLESVGDHESADTLRIILREEVPHVAAGSRWFEYCCDRRGVDPRRTFAALLRRYPAARPKPPFNQSARRQAGFSSAELEWLACLAD